MTWNYRIIKSVAKSGISIYNVHEVYYVGDTEIVRCISEDPIFEGPVELISDITDPEAKSEIIDDLERMIKTLKSKNVIDKKDLELSWSKDVD